MNYYNTNKMNEATAQAVYEPPVEPVAEPQDEIAEKTVPVDNIKDTLDRFLESTNIAGIIQDDELLNKIGKRVVEDYDVDEVSREQWKKDYDFAIKLAKLTRETKNTPWENASNVKLPLITQSAIQFNSRAYADIIKDESVVKGRVVGKDTEGLKAGRAQRIGEHMSYQLLEESESWEEDMDRLLMVIPIVGCGFKKTYYDFEDKQNKSIFVSAEDFCVNYHAKSIKTAKRGTHIYSLTPNEVEERKRAGFFLDIEYGQGDGEKDDSQNDDESSHTFLEQHRWWDLDSDGYREPYIITVHKNTQKVVRIVARWDAEGIITNPQTGELIKIKPVCYFTKFPFLRSMDGGFYEMGFGILLGQTNDVINTAINQLFDSGTDDIWGGGFMSSGIKAQRGELDFKRGEYKIIKNNMGDDINKGIWTRPTAKPSLVMFKLLGFVVEYAEKLSANIQLLAGEQRQSNIPATTTLALIEQGLKVYSGIYKRIYKSLRDEFRKLQRLNRLYLTDEEYFRVHDEVQVIAKEDYEDKDCDVIPIADPNNVTDIQRLTKSEELKSYLGMGLNDNEIIKYCLEAMNIPHAQRFLPDPNQPKQPNIEEMKLILEEKKHELECKKYELMEKKLPIEIARMRADSIRLLAVAESKELGKQLDEYKAKYGDLEKQMDELTNIVQEQGNIIEGEINTENKTKKAETL